MEEQIKSSQSTERVYVRFVNKSGRFADIVWVDFEGVPVTYNTLKPDAYVDVDTFVSHPWIFKDHNTKDKLAVNNELYFLPPSWNELLLKRFIEPPENLPPHRIIVMITLPVYSLRERSLQIVRDDCLNGREKPEILQKMEKLLPKSVFDDLMLSVLRKDGVYIN